MKRSAAWVLLAVLSFAMCASSARVQAQGAAGPTGALRGLVLDKEFDAPLPAALVQVVETGQQATTNEQGNYLIEGIVPGRYTLVFSKDGYVRQVKGGVVVSAARLTEVDVSLSGDFTDMDEYVVQDVLSLGSGSEAALLELRLAEPSFMDSISADVMSRAGASDAAGALRLVTGATVQDGKYAVIRGLPDRYVSSQLNGVRLPSADEDKRAVELDQFPTAVIQSIEVSKTFTPDQQGDASGGAVDVQLRTIPDEPMFQVSVQGSANSQVYGEDDFLGYHGGDRDVQKNKIGEPWKGAVGVSTEDAPTDYKWSTALGGKMELDNGVKVGGYASLAYERDSAFYDDGIEDSYWVVDPGDKLTPQTIQGSPSDGDFKTQLFDVTQSSTLEQRSMLLSVGAETEDHQVGVTYLRTDTTENTTTLAEDTRGKKYYFPGYDPNDPTGPGNQPDDLLSAPYLRTETLDYTQRTTESLQLKGRHTLPEEFSIFQFKAPILGWTLARSSADLDQPDKRQFGSLWHAESFNPGAPPFIPPFTSPAEHLPFKPAANFNLGNLQRIWKHIEEDSDQYSVNLEMPFEQWGGEEGYVKVGVFDDHVDRDFDQSTFSNFADDGPNFQGDFDDFWSKVFPSQPHDITESQFDVDYKGKQDISAWYSMLDLPLSSQVKVIGGARIETTQISVVNQPEDLALWFPPGASAPEDLDGDEADVDFHQRDLLPALALEYEPVEAVTMRASYSQTVARQTFKELTPILQQEFVGGPVFIGNPDLQMSALDNYDLRLDYRPAEETFASASYFYKQIDDPIEYVQAIAGFTYTTPVNYPEGELSGTEFELRQGLGPYWEELSGLSVGANATFISSEVTLPKSERLAFADPAIDVHIKTRDMTGAPEYLYNLYTTYDLPESGTQLSLFYTVTGDTLVAGAGQSGGNFVPDVYAKEFGTLNFTASQKVGQNTTVTFQAKNLTDPRIEEVYRSDVTGGDVTRSSYTLGREFSLGLSVRF